MRTCRISAILFVVLAIRPLPTTACTGIRIHAEDGAGICARTLEFGMDLCSNVIIVPRGKSYVGTTSVDRIRPYESRSRDTVSAWKRKPCSTRK